MNVETGEVRTDEALRAQYGARVPDAWQPVPRRHRGKAARRMAGTETPADTKALAELQARLGKKRRAAKKRRRQIATASKRANRR